MQVITVVGSNGAGSTTVSARLAIAVAAAAGGRVVVLDSDLGFGNLERAFSVIPSCGLADVLAGRCSLMDAMEATAWPGLRVVASGSHSDPTRVLSAAERLLLQQAVEDLRPDCDLLLIDTGISPNLFFFAGLADCPVLVMTPGQDTYGKHAALLTALAAKLPRIAVEVLVNRVEDHANGMEAFAVMAGLCSATIAADLHYLGALPFDGRLDLTRRTAHLAGTLMAPGPHEAVDQIAVRLLTPSAAPARGHGPLLR